MRLIHVFFCTCYKIHYAFDFFALCLGPVQRCKNNIIGAKYYDSNMLGGGKGKSGVGESERNKLFFFLFSFSYTDFSKCLKNFLLHICI